MATLVLTPEIEADVRRLADATGQTLTEAVASAVHEQLQKLPLVEPKRSKASVEELMALVKSYDLKPINDLTEDEILGYDGFGIPEQPYLDRR